MNKELFTVVDNNYEIKGFKYARNDQEEAADSFTLEQQDCGKTIIVYVVVGSATASE